MSDPFKKLLNALEENEKGEGGDELAVLTEAEKKQLQEQMSNLPILEYAQEIKELIKNNETSIIIGETGSGKTTQIPLLLREILPAGAKVAITQPRRVAARSVSKYVAGQVGCEIGDEVGYQVRFDDHTSEGTRMNFMTDGILLRKMQQDPLLKEYAAVMVDEAHERSLNIDFILGLLKRTQRLREQNGLDPLKIIVTSATLEKDKFLNFFDQAPAVEVPGRLFPVDINYEEKTPFDATKAAAEKVEMIVNQGTEGDILIFMPGQQEIFKTINKIEGMEIPGIMILPLYGELSPEEQERIFKPGKTRKVIVSTNIAETSVTIPSVRIVIDSGLINQTEFDAQSGIQSLSQTLHSQGGCIQRAGRAGRVAAGECYRLFTEDDFDKRSQFQKPEILRSNLAHVVLIMNSIGIKNIKNFEFVDSPEPKVLDKALEDLKSLGALDDAENLTSIGKIMAELPLEPHIARMVIEAQKYNCADAVCTIAAFLGGRNVFVRPKDKTAQADTAHRLFKNNQSDFLAYLNVWKAYEKNNGDRDRAYEWTQDRFLNFRVLQEVKSVRLQLLRALSRNNIQATENQNPDAIGKSIAAGLIDNIMEFSDNHSYHRIRDSVPGFYIHPGSAIFGSDYDFVVPAEIVDTSKTYMRLNQVVEPEWIKEIAPQMVREEIGELIFNEREGTAGQTIKYFFKGKLRSYHSEFQEVKGAEATNLLASYLANMNLSSTLDFVRKNKQTMELIQSLAVRSGGAIEPLSIGYLRKFYLSKLGAISSIEELEDALSDGVIDLELKLDDYIDPKTRDKILGDNPESIRLNEKEYKIEYTLAGLGNDRLVMSAIRVPAKEIFELKQIPALRSGRSLLVEAVDDRGNVVASMASTGLDELKKKVSRHFNKDVWVDNAPTQKYIGEKSDFISKKLPELPTPETIGVDPLTSEALMAYPAYVIEYGAVELHYFMEKEEAEEAQHKTEQEISKMRGLLGKRTGRPTNLRDLIREESGPEVPHSQAKVDTKQAIQAALKKKFKK